jgi:hypothetical protein
MRLILLSAVVVALGVPVSTASAVAPPRSVDATLTADVTRVWDANSCCVIARDLEGTTRLAPFGRLRFTGEYDLVVHFVEPTPFMTSALALTFVAANGASFTISGSSDSFDRDELPPAAPWSIVAATGRFSRYSGSGSYTIAGLDPTNLLDATPLSISLVGNVAK